MVPRVDDRGLPAQLGVLTALSIGLLLFPIGAVCLVWVARRSPHLLEGSGFVAGAGATALLVATISG